MQTLKNLAMDGKTVVCSIHQPRSSIFSMFDDLLLLSEGSIIYSGPAKEAISHLESLVCIFDLFMLIRAVLQFPMRIRLCPVAADESVSMTSMNWQCRAIQSLRIIIQQNSLLTLSPLTRLLQLLRRSLGEFYCVLHRMR